MSKNSRSEVNLKLERFGGIDRRTPTSGSAARICRNFRIMPDGSLKKRNGYKTIARLAGTPGCCVETYSDRDHVIYMTIGYHVYSYNLTTDELTRLDCILPNATTKAIVHFKDRYLFFSGNMITDPINDSAYSNVEGYAPLYGKNWDPAAKGEVNEAQNLLSSRYRVNYKISGDETSSLILPDDCLGIERLTVNGIALPDNGYTFDPEAHLLTRPDGFADGSSVTVWANKDQPGGSIPDRMLAKCSCATVAGSGDNAVIFCFGNPDPENAKYVFRSRPVPEKDYLAAKEGFPDMSSLYFPENEKFFLGNGEKTATNVLPLGDKVIVFAHEEAWIVPLRGEISLTLLNPTVGCSLKHGAVICGESPMTIDGHNVYIWKPDAESYNDLSAVCISEPVADLLSGIRPEDCRMFNNKLSGELWICDDSNYTKLPGILVYNYMLGKWYTYSDMSFHYAFCGVDKLCFFNHNFLCYYDPTLEYDLPDGETPTPITASYVGGWSDLDTPDHIKTAGRLTLKARAAGGKIRAEVYYDDDRSEKISIKGKNDFPVIMSAGLVRRRFRQCSLGVFAENRGKADIFGLGITARPADIPKNNK